FDRLMDFDAMSARPMLAYDRPLGVRVFLRRLAKLALASLPARNVTNFLCGSHGQRMARHRRAYRRELAALGLDRIGAFGPYPALCPCLPLSATEQERAIDANNAA